MHLYLDSFGAFLSVRNGAFRVRMRSGEERSFAVRLVTAILLTKGTAMSTDAALLAAAHDVPVLLIDANTHFPLAQVSSGRPGSTAAIRRGQLVFSRQAEGMAWINGVLRLKMGRQMEHLRALPGQFPSLTASDVDNSLRVMNNLQQRMERWAAPAPWDEATYSAAAETFRGQEGTASRVYFATLGEVFATLTGQDFPGRIQQPAYDPANALLNYLYGILYTQVHLALLKSGIDPYIGVLHADRYGGAPVLVFDCIEPYRPWADAVAVQILGDICRDVDVHFGPNPDETGLWLTSAGKSIAIDAALAMLASTDVRDGRQVRRSVQIDADARALAGRIVMSYER